MPNLLSHWIVIDFLVILSFNYVQATMNVDAYCHETLRTLGAWFYYHYYPVDTWCAAWLAFGFVMIRAQSHLIAFPGLEIPGMCAKSSWASLKNHQINSNNTLLDGWETLSSSERLPIIIIIYIYTYMILYVYIIYI